MSTDIFASLSRELAPEARLDAAEAVHSGHHVEQIADVVPETELTYLDPDTVISPGSLTAALHAVGGATRAVDAIMSGQHRNAFCAMRPPGHHAETDRAMGFCLFNSVAIAARHAQSRYGAERVAVFDFDVHHGNGTQDIFWDDPSVIYASTHQMPLYPGTGAAGETGAGNIVNVPLAPGDDGEAFRRAVTNRIVPAIREARPDLILLSAGFDAHERDPLANLRFTEQDFAWVTERMMALADDVCDGRLVSVLEGGYDLEGLSRSVAAHVTTLMNA